MRKIKNPLRPEIGLAHYPTQTEHSALLFISTENATLEIFIISGMVLQTKTLTGYKLVCKQQAYTSNRYYDEFETAVTHTNIL